MKSNDTPGRRGIKASAGEENFILEFDTIDKEFQRGFECGEIWACLCDGDVAEVRSIISAENAEMVMRMAAATGYSYEGRYITDLEIDEMKIGPGDWMVIVMRADDGE